MPQTLDVPQTSEGSFGIAAVAGAQRPRRTSLAAACSKEEETHRSALAPAERVGALALRRQAAAAEVYLRKLAALVVSLGRPFTVQSSSCLDPDQTS